MKSGKNIKILTEYFRLSSREMAELLNTSESHFYNILQNKNNLIVEKALIISAFFKLDLNALYECDEYEFHKLLVDKGKTYFDEIKVKLNLKFKNLPPPAINHDELNYTFTVRLLCNKTWA